MKWIGQVIKMSGNEVGEIETFKYLGFTLKKDCGFEKDTITQD